MRWRTIVGWRYILIWRCFLRSNRLQICINRWRPTIMCMKSPCCVRSRNCTLFLLHRWKGLRPRQAFKETGSSFSRSACRPRTTSTSSGRNSASRAVSRRSSLVVTRFNFPLHLRGCIRLCFAHTIPKVQTSPFTPSALRTSDRSSTRRAPIRTFFLGRSIKQTLHFGRSKSFCIGHPFEECIRCFSRSAFRPLFIWYFSLHWGCGVCFGICEPVKYFGRY